MAIVEGIGDEVIHVLIGVGVVLLSVLAWWSTHIRENSLYRTIVIVERNNRHVHHPTNNNNADTIDQNIDPLGGLQVRRTVQTTISTSDPSTPSSDVEESESSPSHNMSLIEPIPRGADSGSAQSASDHNTTSEDRVDLAQSSITSENAAESDSYQSVNSHSTSSLQTDRPLLVGDSSSNTTDNSNPDPPDDESDTNKIKIRLKYLNDRERIVDGKLSELLGDFKKRHFRSELSSNQVVRLIYNGHLLRHDNSTLETCGMCDNCVVHCMVHPVRTSPHQHDRSRRSHPTGGLNQNNSNNNSNANPNGPSNNNNNNSDDWGDLGGIFYALITVILCSVWYWRFQHSHLFSFTATAALTSITAIFAIFVFSITFFHNDEIPIEVM